MYHLHPLTGIMGGVEVTTLGLGQVVSTGFEGKAQGLA